MVDKKLLKLSFISSTVVSYFKQALKCDWLCYSKAFSLVWKMRFRAKSGAIREPVAPVRANQITRITGNVKMDVIDCKMNVGAYFCIDEKIVLGTKI